MSVKDYVEIVSVATGLLAVGGVVIQRVRTGKGIGARVVQFAVVVLLIPTVLILGLERIMTDATLGTLLGGIAGYVLSRVGEYTPRRQQGQTADD